MNKRNRIISWIAVSLIFLGLIYLLVGCAKSITPTTVVSTSASYDSSAPAAYKSTAPTSGILDFAPNGGRVVTFHFRDRYNSLVDLYADQFNPPLKHDIGFECGKETCVIDRQHLIYMGQMVQWKRNGRESTMKKKGFRLWN